MKKSIKIMLIPNNKQKSKMIQSASVARFAYNWALAKQRESYDNSGKFLSNFDLRKKFTQLKKQYEYKWLNNYSNDITKQAIKDACISYNRFFKGISKFPKFKCKKKSKPSFYIDTEQIQFTEKHIKLTKLTLSKRKNKQKFNWIRLAEKNKIPTDSKYINPRITFDGLNWWISVGIEYADNVETPVNDGIGIDLGIKDLAICSDIDKPYKNINKTQKIRKLKKKKRRLQRKISRKYLINKKGDSYCKTSNIIKAEKKLLKLNCRLTNIRNNYLHQTTTEIVKRKPKFIVLEDLNVKGMLKNKKLSKYVAEECFFEFYRQIEYKSSWNNIKFIVADRFFASSKICSCCGAVKRDLKRSERIYKCTNCNTVIDRDKNASINLMKYGKSIA
ncbi:MAG: RNA-guided endonuclease InsQ/TnpB family protein [Clostridium butyricum]